MFQFHHLLPAFTATENVLMPGLIAHGPVTAPRREAARDVLRAVGLGDRLDYPPRKLSGGQQQRVAIARALSLAPPLVLADEPTGNLDTHSADEIFALMRRFNAERGVAFLIVTHDARLARRCDRIVELVDGTIAGDQPNSADRGDRASAGHSDPTAGLTGACAPGDPFAGDAGDPGVRQSLYARFASP